jgi:hypothetical protein
VSKLKRSHSLCVYIRARRESSFIVLFRSARENKIPSLSPPARLLASANVLRVKYSQGEDVNYHWVRERARAWRREEQRILIKKFNQSGEGAIIWR